MGEDASAQGAELTEEVWDSSAPGNGKNPGQAIRSIHERVVGQVGRNGQAALFALLDLHHHLNDSLILRSIKDIAQHARSGNDRVCLVSGDLAFPREWVGEVDQYAMPLVGSHELMLMVRTTLLSFAGGESESAALQGRAWGKTTLPIADALTGLAANEAESVLRIAAGAWKKAGNSIEVLVRGGELGAAGLRALIGAIQLEKQSRLSLLPGLQARIPERGLSDIGGNAALKKWIAKVGVSFRPEYAKNGGDLPRGCMLLGPGGTGKSVLAEAIAQEWGAPMFEMHMDEFMDSKLGESEGRIRQALARIEAQGRCVLFVDEIDKSVGAGDAETDGNTSQRMLGILLKWLARDRAQPVFVVFAGNRIGGLPPELTRAGRLDAQWVLLPPDKSARMDILRIHLEKRGIALDSIGDISELADGLDGYTGAELEQIVKEALLSAYYAGEALALSHLREAASEVPSAMSGERGLDEVAQCAQYIADRFARSAA